MAFSIDIPSGGGGNASGGVKEPLIYRSSVGYGQDKYKKSSWFSICMRYLRTILQNPATRKVFFFLLLNLVFTVVEAVYGVLTNSMGLISDAVHMLFDSTAIILSLVASVIAKWGANDKYTYGFGRVETLTGFLNAAVLLFASISILWESVERLYQPQEINTDSLLVVSILGLLVNIVGIFCFDHGHMEGLVVKGHSHGGTACGGHGGHDDDHGNTPANSTKNPLMHGMFLHILSDTLGSVGVIVSCLLIQAYDWKWSDPACAIFISVLTVISVWPLLKESGYILLQRIPLELDSKLGEAYRKISSMEGVIGFTQPHFWELCTDTYYGSIKIQAHEKANSQKIRIAVTQMFKKLGVRDVVVQVEQDAISAY